VNIFTDVKEGLANAWDAIRANKMRSVLTTLGIIIGIVTVTAMATAIDALNQAFHESISILGADVLFVSRTTWADRSYEQWLNENKRRDITRQQAREVERQMYMASAVAPVVGMNQRVWYKNRFSSRVWILGSTDQFLETSGFTISQGRFLTENEAEGGRPVCVIGNDVATNLFQHESPLGRRVIIGARRLEVIGVLGKRGSFLGMDSFDNRVIIPIQQFLIGYWRNPNFDVEVKIKDLNQLGDAKEELRGLMRKIRHVAPGDPDDFSINQQEQFIKTFEKVTGTIATVGLLITGMALFVGGIGIMNIMFVSVAERTREIGVRKAIGARPRSILLQFLIEAALICLLGGLIALGIT
jgi:putative ABC transport system permease protein